MAQAQRRGTIAKRITMMNLLVTAIALLLACAGFFAYDQFTFRQSLVRTLSAQAQIIASNSVSSILFNDPQAAYQTLSALKSSQNISAAGIFNLNNSPFATYSRQANNEIVSFPVLGPDQVEGYWFRSTHLILVRKIMSQNKPVGFVYLRADLQEIDERLQRYALIAIAVLLISLFVATLISSRFSKSVALPIVQLAETADQVSRSRDYSVRVPPSGKRDEVSLLIDSFNEMLREIQRRDNALRQAQDELEQRVADRTRELVSANRELEAFSYSVSHDLRGPLDSLNGFVYVLLKQYGAKLDEQARELIQQIRASGKRMISLVDDLLNLSRVTTSVMHEEKVDLSAVARSIMEELCRIAPQRKVDFVAPVTDEAYGDAHLLHIVMDNLLRNAWKYTSRHDSARIEFGQEMKRGHMAYFVRDDGSGFDQRSADRLFQPFQRLHSAEQFPGSGIGLATVRRIIQRHGGEIWAEGAIEKGATFYFTLGPVRGSSTAPSSRAAQ